MKMIRLKITDAYFEFAEQQAKRLDTGSAEKYLQMLLNGALVHEAKDEEDYKSLPPLFPFFVFMPDEDDSAIYEVFEDPGGGVHHKDDPDDGIPF